MQYLQIDSLSNLRNNQGFWDNFVWPLLLAITIGVFVLLTKKIFKKRVDGGVSPLHITLQESPATISTFYELCQQILPFLIENRYIFKTFGPNSSAQEMELLRMDMTLWKQARTDFIIPNNERIATLLNKNKDLIPAINLGLFQQLSSHIYAFKKHVENEDFDYSDFQFPSEIDNVIKETCIKEAQRQPFFLNAVQQIRNRLKFDGVKQIVLFGSFLFYSNNKNDIDFAILLDYNSNNSSLNKLNIKFEKAKV
jgi:predicted nucleotidyltransferase